MEFPCFCDQKAKSFQCKNGDVIFICGTDIDFKKMREVLMMKASPEKEEALQKLDLGCNMKMKGEDIYVLYVEANAPVKREHIPKCEHHLLARVGVSSSKQNLGRIYFSCNTKVPDVPCNFFQWFDEKPKPKSKKRKHPDEESSFKNKESKKLSRKKQKTSS